MFRFWSCSCKHCDWEKMKRKGKGEKKRKKSASAPPSKTKKQNQSINQTNKKKASPHLQSGLAWQPDWKSRAEHRGPPTKNYSWLFHSTLKKKKKKEGKKLLGSANEDWVAIKHNGPPFLSNRDFVPRMGMQSDKTSSLQFTSRLSTRAREAHIWDSPCTRSITVTAEGHY